MSKKYKHLTLDDRIEIQECLNKGMTFKAIGKRISKDPTTVSKEVKLHNYNYENSFVRKPDICPKLLKAPYVCNGCPHRNHSNCPYPRKKYIAKQAQKDYETLLTDAREGIPLTKEEFYETEKIISSAVKSGQHIYHAIAANNLKVSKSTVYRHIENGYYTISKIDLPRSVKFKPRKEHKGEYVPKGIRINRTFEDFLLFIDENPQTNYVEMDTVIGKPGGKVLMTFQFVNVDFMFGLLLDNKTAAEAAQKITLLKKKFEDSMYKFSDIFPVLLTDNGGEFSNVQAFENDLDGELATHMFFCDPNSPYQKPHVENNHTLLRSILASGTSFDALTQENVNTIFSHINSVKRKQFNGKSSYDMFTFTYSEDIARLLGISKIEPTDVIQNSKLLKKLS